MAEFLPGLASDFSPAKKDAKMQVIVTGRKMNVTPALRNYAEQKARRITKHIERVIEAHIVLSVEKYRHKAEVTINANGFIIHGEEVTGDMYSSIDQVMDKLESQIKKYKARLTRKGRLRRVESRGKLWDEGEPAEELEEEVDRPKIIRKRGFAVKPMSPEEAVMQMELLGEDLLVYRNSISNEVNVVYRRKDGNIGLIEPDV
jgi:putative sigma-54 modulation protein